MERLILITNISRNLYGKKVVRTLLGIAVLVLLSITMFMTLSRAFPTNADDQKKIESMQKIEVQVEYGDTAWNLQSALIEGEDVRYILYLAEKLNGKDLSNLQIGDTIILLSNT